MEKKEAVSKGSLFYYVDNQQFNVDIFLYLFETQLINHCIFGYEKIANKVQALSAKPADGFSAHI
jgi:hypothetical protein